MIPAGNIFIDRDVVTISNVYENLNLNFMFSILPYTRKSFCNANFPFYCRSSQFSSILGSVVNKKQFCKKKSSFFIS